MTRPQRSDPASTTPRAGALMDQTLMHIARASNMVGADVSVTDAVTELLEAAHAGTHADVLAFYQLDGKDLSLVTALGDHDAELPMTLPAEPDAPLTFVDLSPRWSSVHAARLRHADQTLGAVVALAAAPDALDADDIALLELAASVATSITRIAELTRAERRSRLAGGHARRHLTLLSQGSRALGAVTDDEDAALHALARVVVDEFAEWCAIDVVRDGGVRRIAYAHADASQQGRVRGLLEQFPGWAVPVARVIGSGHSELQWDVSRAPERAEDADHHAVAAALALRSCLIVPIRIQGLSVGAITCGSTPPQRGYRPSDVDVVEELAARTATAIERISLHRETQRAAEEVTLRAAQLRRLMAAALVVQPRHRTEEVADVLARQACIVLGTRHAVVTVTGGGIVFQVTAGAPWADVDTLLARAEATRLGEGATMVDESTGAIEALAVRLNNHNGRAIGTLAVAGKESGSLTADDESILIALAQLGAAALENARLYENVRSGESRLLALIDAAPLAILELDVDGAILRSNAAAQRLLGNVDGGTLTLHADTALLLRRIASDAIAGRAMGDIEGAVLRAGGTEVPVTVSAALLRDADGTIDGVLVMAADLTARHQLEDQLVRAQRIEVVGQVAGGIAHDFNNLLTVILGHATLLAAALPDDDVRAEDTRAISMAAQRAATITSQLLTISRGDLAPTTVFDPRDRVVDMADTLRSIVPETVELAVSVEPGDGLVRMSPGQFDQVVLNLAVNARDAMPDAGVLALRLFEDGEVVIEVTDNGVGMDAATAARCFEPFFSTKGGERGTGLGLATVQSVVSGVGGHVAVTTAPGRGTTFTVRLPRAVGSVVGHEPGPTGTRGGSERILIVEDQAGLRRLAVEVLRAAGYVVTAAADGQAALDLIAEDGDVPDLVVTDVVMPRIGGVELVRRLRTEHPGLAALFMTGYVDETSRTGLRDADILIKPFLITDLVDRVRTALDRAALDRAQGSKR